MNASFLKTGAPDFDSFEEAVAYFGKQGASGTEAMSTAAFHYPELLEKFQWNSTISPRAPYAKKAIPPAIADFERLIEQIAERDKVTRTVAMSTARRENPAAYAAYQHA